jgi:hypothetical protein
VRRLGPLVVSLVLLMLVAGVIGGATAVIAGVALGVLGPLGILVSIVVVPTGVIALVVLLARTTLAGPAILLEGHGPIAGLRRSWAMTRGHTWRLLGLLLVVGLIASIASAGSGYLGSYSVDRWVAALGLVLGTLVVAPLYGIPTALVFLDLGGAGGAPVAAAPSAGGAPVGGSPVAPAPAAAASAPAGPAAAASAAAAPAAIEPRIRVGRGRWVAMGIIIGIGIVLAVVGGAAADGSGGLAYVPDRGKILAGGSFNLFEPCRPDDVATTFSPDDEIRVGGYFSEAIPADKAGRLRFFLDGEELVDEPLEASFIPLDCWFEPEALVDLPPGAYRIEIVYEGRTIAEGGFRVD